MKLLLVAVLSSVALSCTTSHKNLNREPNQVTNISSDLRPRIIMYFDGPKKEFNEKVKKIRSQTVATINNVNRHPSVKSCREDALAKRFFTNACTEAKSICERSITDPFSKITDAYLDTILSSNMVAANSFRQLAKKKPQSVNLQKLSFYFDKISIDMKNGLEILLERNFSDRSVLALGPAFSGVNETYDNKDNFEQCMEKIASPLLFMDGWQQDFNSLIPQ